ncbi:radical SAM/SPASM domain-containing protein [Streptococcus hyovaginalis]|uniref:radical SAM/SPASM domain-containing protein n=1 Tax=Streptococcus hyovaginalis TaxID=149015 RepID=UPI0004A44E1F|nr:SPASM domain-containing protein [Streptococcus hyovaginalis]
MKRLSVLIKPASSLCNLKCRYCFYADVCSLREVASYGRMTKDTAKHLVDNIFKDLEDGDDMTFAFQGGEPTMAGLSYFKYFIALVSEAQKYKRVTVHYSLQTNGTLITDKWCQFLKEHDFLVGLSIDGTQKHHDLNRVDRKGRGTFKRVMKTKYLFDAYGIDYNILCVLINSLAKDARGVYRFLKENHISHVQFIPCLGDLETNQQTPYQLTPSRFQSFYKTLFGYWFKDLKKGQYISIKLFDDILQLLINRKVTACGILGQCQIQFVIEADGGVYPCDFYVLDDYKLGNICEEGLKSLLLSKRSKNFLCRRREINTFCQNCPFKTICRGGCYRMRDVMFIDEKAQLCGYQSFLKVFITHLDEMVYYIPRVLA